MTQEQDEAQAQADKVLEAGTRVTLVDTVSYTGFAPGQALSVAGVLMDKETGAPVTDASGEEVRGQTSFTTQDADGTVEVAFELDTTGLAGKELVAFETASAEDGSAIAEHADLDNADQTVYVQEEPETPPETPQSPETPDEPQTAEEPDTTPAPGEEQPAADTPAEKAVFATPSATGDAARRIVLIAIAAAAAANLAYLHASRKRRQACADTEQEQ